MNLSEAQKDMRQSYSGGSSGALVSGLIWIIAGITAFFYSEKISIIVFFFGGMMIHPMGILIDKLMNRTGKHQKENPLGKLAMESTLILFIGLFIAYLVFQLQPEWFYPIMLLMIGGRYVIFQSIYGMRIYWIFGLALIAVGVASLVLNFSFPITPIMGGTIELVFAILIFTFEKRTHNL